MQQSKPGGPDNGDNSQFWRGGVFYVNRNDPRLLVEKRSGLGLTFNLAHPVAWVLLGIIIAVIVAFVLIVPHLI
jgi:uncharacterized membrane protein